MASPPRAILIPARKHSRRLKNKHLRLLRGHPVIAYTIAKALTLPDADVWLCSDDEAVLEGPWSHCVRRFYRQHSGPDETDFEWVSRFVDMYGRGYETLCILRPTSPFLSARLVCEALKIWDLQKRRYDSSRAMTKTTAHPGKMWIRYLHRSYIFAVPLQPMQPAGTPWHSQPTQLLPDVFIQTAGLEIFHTKTILETGTISGQRIFPFEVTGPDAFDLNTPEDWLIASHSGWALPRVPEWTTTAAVGAVD